MVDDGGYALKKWRKSGEIDVSRIGPHNLIGEKEFAVLAVGTVVLVRIERLAVKLCF